MKVRSYGQHQGIDIEIRVDEDQGEEDNIKLATMLRGVETWAVTCEEDLGLACELSLAEAEARFADGSYREVVTRFHIRRKAVPSHEEKRKRAVRRSPEEMKADWDTTIQSGLARPAGPSDHPELLEESKMDVWCIPCGRIIGGTGVDYNALNFYQHCTSGDHESCLVRFTNWNAVLSEEPSLAIKVADAGGEGGFSEHALSCVVCSTEETPCVIKGNNVRYQIKSFSEHCRNVGHRARCTGLVCNALPAVVLKSQEKKTETVRNFFSPQLPKLKESISSPGSPLSLPALGAPPCSSTLISSTTTALSSAGSPLSLPVLGTPARSSTLGIAGFGSVLGASAPCCGVARGFEYLGLSTWGAKSPTTPWRCCQ